MVASTRDGLGLGEEWIKFGKATVGWRVYGTEKFRDSSFLHNSSIVMQRFCIDPSLGFSKAADSFMLLIKGTEYLRQNPTNMEPVIQHERKSVYLEMLQSMSYLDSPHLGGVK
jgi:hypothetical protein